MSDNFNAYAAYYDLIYRDKDYASETRYVESLIQRHCPGAREVLELGCGTGIHAVELARRGYAVMGVDRSSEMTTRAGQRAATAISRDGVPPVFSTGDLRDFRAQRKFDAVISLFHVMSYQVANRDLAAAMATAAEHLRPGGLFLFDCWYGPGVLTDPPVVRVLRLEDEASRVTRIAEPEHRPNENRVDVHYDIRVERADGTDSIRETHPMRYLFAPEVDLMLELAGMERVGLYAWMRETAPDASTWNACFVAARR